MTVEITLEGLTSLNAKFAALPNSIRNRLRPVMAGATQDLYNLVKSNIAARFHSTGPLYQSVKSELSEDSSGFVGRVYTDGIVYAAIQEYGGTVHIPEITPVRAKVLAFMANARMGFSGGPKSSGMVFTMRTRAHPVTIPERSYAREALAYERVPFRASIYAMVAEALST